MRSSINPRSGFGPMSARKFSKFIHRSQMEIPRPPQYENLGWSGFRQRPFMQHHAAYVGWILPRFANPCRNVVRFFARVQPQLFEVPILRRSNRYSFTVPQSQMQSRYVRSWPDWKNMATGVNIPNFLSFSNIVLRHVP